MVTHPFTVELTESLRPSALGFDMTVGDDNAHEISIDVTNGGTPFDMTGGTAGLYVLRPIGTSVRHPMTIAADNLSASISSQACAYPGRAHVFVKLLLGGDTIYMFSRYATVRDGVTCDGIVDPGESIPSLEALIAAAEDADAAAELALDAVATITGLTVEAETLEAGVDATAGIELDEGDGHINLVFGLPRGAQGIQGEKGDDGDQGPKGDPGDPLIILGTYADLAALRTAVPSPDIGDMYNVGAAAPYSIHRATGLASPNDWEDQGTLQATTDAADMDITDAGSYYTSETVEGALQEIGLGKINKSLFDAQSILAATTDNTPSALTVAEQTVVGRLTGGTIDDIALGIADNNVVQIDHAAVADDDYARFTANGLEGRSPAEVLSDVGAAPVATVAMIAAGGIFSGGAVTAQGSPGQTVAVEAVSYVTPTGKRYSLSAVASLAAAAADGANPRIDIVYGSDAGVVTYLAGTAAGSPTQPSTPSNGTLLASITRAANDNTIAAGDITKKRKFIATADQFVNWIASAAVTNAHACDCLNLQHIQFAIANADATAKTLTLTNVPYGRCEVVIEIDATSYAPAFTWTLNSGSTVAWIAATAPVFSSGKKYRLFLMTSDSGATWDGFYTGGIA